MADAVTEKLNELKELKEQVRTMRLRLDRLESGDEIVALKARCERIEDEAAKRELRLIRRNTKLETENRVLQKENEELQHYRRTVPMNEIYNLLTIIIQATNINRELLDVIRLRDEEIASLRGQVTRDCETSSLPSSMTIGHKSISNSREKSGLKPGGQKGHPGHKRMVPTPDRVVYLDDSRYANNPRFKKMNRVITKTEVNVVVKPDVTAYVASVYYDTETKRYVHPDFPEHMVNEVEYSGTLKAVCLYLSVYANVANRKIADFISTTTNGVLQPSVGFISRLSSEFANKSKDEISSIWQNLVTSEVMHIDNTATRVNGKNNNVAVCASGNDTLYTFTEKKGHEAVRATPAKFYKNTMVHDHDITFYSYGGDHQECLQHVERYLKDSMRLEKDRTWNRQMHFLIRKMIHYVKHTDEDPLDEKRVAFFEAEYDRICALAEKEYKEKPPSDFYKNGEALSKRLREYKDSHLLFLHKRVPYTNNLCERHVRNFKRKQKQAVSFRAKESVRNICTVMSVFETCRGNGQNVLKQAEVIFNRHAKAER